MSLGVLEGPSPRRPALGLVYDNKTPDDATKALQQQINVLLIAKGMATITADGKLGPATCGGARYLDQNSGTTLQAQYGLTSICKSYTDPKPPGAATTPKPVNISASTTSPDAFAEEQSMILGVPVKTAAMIGLGVVGIYLFMQKKKKGSAP